MVLYPGYIGGERVEIGILEAAASGNVSIIRRWLEDGGDANEEITAGPWDYPRANLLHYVAGVSNGAVAEEGRLAIVRLLLAHGANANAIANRPHRACVSPQDARRLATGSAGPPRPARPSRVPVLAGGTAAPSESPCRRRYALERVSSRYEYARLIPPTLRAAANSPRPPPKKGDGPLLYPGGLNVQRGARPRPRAGANRMSRPQGSGLYLPKGLPGMP